MRARAGVRLLALLPLVLVVILAGCGGDDDGPPEATSSSAATSTTPSPSSTPTGSPGASPTDEEPPDDGSFPADTSDDGGPAEPGAEDDPEGQMHVSGLRLASHDGYARLVVDLNTSGVPEWTVRYTEASGPGGGPVEIQGDAFLRVVLQTNADMGVQSTSRIRTSPGPIAEALTTGFFEGYEEVLIGIRGGEQPFRAFALTDPGRIVIDVRDPG